MESLQDHHHRHARYETAVHAPPESCSSKLSQQAFAPDRFPSPYIVEGSPGNYSSPRTTLNAPPAAPLPLISLDNDKYNLAYTSALGFAPQDDSTSVLPYLLPQNYGEFGQPDFYASSCLNTPPLGFQLNSSLPLPDLQNPIKDLCEQDDVSILSFDSSASGSPHASERDAGPQRPRSVHPHLRHDSKTRIRRDRTVSNPTHLRRHSEAVFGLGIDYGHTTNMTQSMSMDSASLPSSRSPYLEPYPVFPAAITDQNSFQGSYRQPLQDYGLSYQTHFAPSPALYPSSTPSSVASERGKASPYPPSSANGSPNSSSSEGQVRVITPRPKPRCWDHGCNGRQFSTFSNLLRHQREKSGTSTKSYCPRCGAEFTRTTARNGHMRHEKCRMRRDP
ncbi:MAG: hypothetical protein M1829_004620 [Trizodia sp. TS-e1964]|nr:MAG: hypothetical protein M1829_004620 [Trizodia sp. TS-e1964]